MTAPLWLFSFFAEIAHRRIEPEVDVNSRRAAADRQNQVSLLQYVTPFISRKRQGCCCFPKSCESHKQIIGSVVRCFSNTAATTVFV